MYSTQRFDNVLNDITVVVDNAAAAYVGPAQQSPNRQGFVVANVDSAATLYFKFYTGSALPTVSPANFHFQLAPGAEKTVMAGGAVKLCGLSSGATDTNAQFVEIL